MRVKRRAVWLCSLLSLFAVPVSARAQRVISITSPADGATVSGKVTVATQESSKVSWINVFADGVWFASNDPNTSRPYSVQWDSTQFPDGPHTVSVTGYSSRQPELGSYSIGLNIANGALAAPSPMPASTSTPVVTPAPTPTPMRFGPGAANSGAYRHQRRDLGTEPDEHANPVLTSTPGTTAAPTPFPTPFPAGGTRIMCRRAAMTAPGARPPHPGARYSTRSPTWLQARPRSWRPATTLERVTITHRAPAPHRLRFRPPAARASRCWVSASRAATG